MRSLPPVLSPGLAVSRSLQIGRGIVADPYAAHVARTQAIDDSGSYYTGHDYTASLSQAGLFVDAFSGALTINSPNVQASAMRVVDGQSGIAYAAADGVDDIAVGSAAQVVMAYCVVARIRAQAFFGWVVGSDSGGSPGGFCLRQYSNNSTFDVCSQLANYSSADAISPASVVGAPWAIYTGLITSAGAITLRINGNTVATGTGGSMPAPFIVSLFSTLAGSLFSQTSLAAVRLWAATPSASVVVAPEQEFASYYGALLGTNS